MHTLVIVGGGAFGTALGNSLSFNKENKVVLLARDSVVVSNINSLRCNSKYFSHVMLNERLRADIDKHVLSKADIIFLAIPSMVVPTFILESKKYIKPESMIVNLAKGFGKGSKTLVDTLKGLLPYNQVLSMKGPTFADELIRCFPSAFTVGSENEQDFEMISENVQDTNICLDFSQDVLGVELLSILKNIYAIALGIVDAQFNSANTRFLFLTKAFNEIKRILKAFGGNEETLYRYCGIGDLGLTGLNDISRNRTLGLMIGKGFLQNLQDQSSVVLEGIRAVKVIYSKMLSQNKIFPIIDSLYKLLEGKISTRDFIDYILNEGEI